MAGDDLNRRQFVVGGISNVPKLALAAGASMAMPNLARAKSKPNILFIAVDDLNDWIEPLGGYDGVQTPNFNRLARVTRSFRRAYTSAPACSPARTSVMFGVQPFHSGVYTNFEYWQTGSRLIGQKSLPRVLKDHGYLTVGAGKIFHDGWRSASQRPGANDPEAWSDYDFCKGEGEECELSDVETQGTVKFTEELSFGPASAKTSEMPDIASVRWFNKRVLSTRHARPFFGAIGLRKPHGPFTVPRRFFDLYGDDRLHYPPGVLDPNHNTLAANEDVKDLPPAAIAMLKQFGAKDHARIVGGRTNYWMSIVHAYLATISFTDYCLGLILDAWLKGPNAGNTIVVLWSDHGWQLGEKMGWRKFTLWERATRVPYMIGGAVGDAEIRPGVADYPVSTLGIFPTVTDVALNLVPKASELGGLRLDGVSLKNTLFDLKARSGAALTTWMLKTGESDAEGRQRHFSVRKPDYRLIAYGNGDRELYDHRSDPYEFNNLLAEPTAEAEATAKRLSKFLPDPAECVGRAAA